MKTQLKATLPEKYRLHWDEHRSDITARLEEFRAVPPEEYFYELLYCLLTPQSRAVHAERVIAKLRTAGFPEQDVDPVPFLRDPAHYIRFHNVKAERIRALRNNWEEIKSVLLSPDADSASKRAWLVANVNGLGWKEASHFLRNIGHLDLAIIDRHILKHLAECNAIDVIPTTISRSKYLEIESRFAELARSFGVTLQELDLLFWSFEEGSVRK